MKMIRCCHPALFLLVLQCAVFLCLAAAAHAAPAISQTIDLIPGADTYQPIATAVDATRNRLYAIGTGDQSGRLGAGSGGRLSIIDVGSHSVIAGIALGTMYPVAVAVDPVHNRAYVAGQIGFVDNMPPTFAERGVYLAVIDTTNKTLLQTLQLKSDPNPPDISRVGGIAVNTSTQKVYASIGGELCVIDGTNPASFTMVPGVGSGPVVLNEATNMIYVGDYFTANPTQVYPVNGANNTVGTPIVAPSGMLLIDAAGNKVYALDSFFGTEMAVINTTTNTVSATYNYPDVAFNSYQYSAALDAAGGRIYVAAAERDGTGNQTAVIKYIDLATPGQVGGTIPSSPILGLNFNPGTGRLLYAAWANYSGLNDYSGFHGVAELDPATGTATRISTGAKPSAVAYNENNDTIYVADENLDSLYVIEAATGVLKAPIAGIGFSLLGGGGTTAFRALALNPTTNRLYVSGYSSDQFDAFDEVRTIDCATNTVIATTTLGSTMGFLGLNAGLAVNPTTNKIYASGRSGLFAIDGVTHAVTPIPGIMDTQNDSGVARLAVDSTGNRLYVARWGSAVPAVVVDLTTNTKLREFAFFYNPPGIAVHEPSNRYLIVEGENVFSVNLATNETDNLVKFQNGGTSGIAANPTNNEAFVLTRGLVGIPGSLNFFDIKTQVKGDQLTVGNLPVAIAVNPQDREVYVANYADATISIAGGIAPPGGGGGDDPLSVSIAAEATGDPTGEKVHPGEEITYTVSVRNTGTTPISRVVITSPIPVGTKVDAQSVAASDGKVVKKKVQWKIRSLPPEATARTFTFKVKVRDYAGLAGTFILNSASAFGRGVDAIAAPSVGTEIIDPLVATVAATPGTVEPGEDITYRITVRNRSTVPLGSVEVGMGVPARTTLRFSGSPPAFLDGGDQPGPRIDFATGREVVVPHAFPYDVHTFQVGNQTRRANPGYPEDFSSVSWWFGDMGPGETQVLRMTVRVRYDELGTGTVLPAAPAVARNVKLKNGERKSSLPGIVAGPNPGVDVTGVAAAKPILEFSYKHEGLGYDERGRVLTTNEDANAPGTDLRANEVRFKGVYQNHGTAPAENITGWFIIPAEASFVKGSLLVGGVPVAVPSAEARLVDEKGEDVPEIEPDTPKQKFLRVLLPYLDVVPAERSYEFKVRVGKKTDPGTIFTSEAVLRCADLAYGIVLAQPSVLATRVVKAAAITKRIEIVRPPELPDGAPFRHAHIFENAGPLALQDVTVDIPVPAGAKFEPDLTPVPPNGAPKFPGVRAVLRRPDQSLLKFPYEAIGKPGSGATTGRVRVQLDRLDPGAQLVVTVDWKAVLANRPASGEVPAESQLYHAFTGPPPPFALPPGARLAGTGTPELYRHTDFLVGAGEPRLWVGQMAPACVDPSVSDEVTFIVMWGNTSNRIGNGSMGPHFAIPAGTTFVRATNERNSAQSSNVVAQFATTTAFPNGVVSWTTAADPHITHAATVTVRLNADVRSITSGGIQSQNAADSIGDVGFIDRDGRIRCNSSPITVTVCQPGQTAGDVVISAVGGNLDETLQVVVQSVAGQQDLARLGPDTLVMGLGGVSFYQMKDGQVVIPVGLGQIVAAGGGNIVAGGGGNIKNTTLDLLGQDASSIVAAGGGNLINLRLPNGGQLVGLDGASLKDIAASIVAAGGGNIVAAGGGNVIPGVVGNIVAAGGGNLLGQDGASLLGQDAASLKNALIDNDSGLILPSDYKSLLGGALSEKIILDPEALLNPQASGDIKAIGTDMIVSAATGHVVPKIGASVVANDVAGIVAGGGGNIVAAGGGNVVANDGAGAPRPRPPAR